MIARSTSNTKTQRFALKKNYLPIDSVCVVVFTDGHMGAAINKQSIGSTAMIG